MNAASNSMAGVVATDASPHARLRPVAIRTITMHNNGFWKPRMEANHRAALA